MGNRSHSDRVQRAIKEYNDQHPENKIEESVSPKEEPKDERNFVVKVWDKLGKTGQVITLVAGILTGLTTIKPYVVDAIDYGKKFIYSVEHTQNNTKEIGELKKYNEITSSILKSLLFPYYHENPDGSEVKLYKTRDVDGNHMTYHFVDCCMFFAANYNIESGKWYYIDDKGGYHEIEGKQINNKN